MTSAEANEANTRYGIQLQEAIQYLLDLQEIVNKLNASDRDMKNKSLTKIVGIIYDEIQQLITDDNLYKDAHNIALTVDPNCLPRFGIG